MKKRCDWVKPPDFYIRYHDEEWGVPVHEDRRHFELLTLEGAQAGLSWQTVLSKRAGYRQAFAGFDVAKIATFDRSKLEALCQDPDIVRNRCKIQATIVNAQQFLKIQAESGSFDAYLWDFVDGHPIVNHWRSHQEVPGHTTLSDQIAKDLKQRGFQFIGSTTVYAYLQAAGLVNDHLVTCFRYRALAAIGSGIINGDEPGPYGD